MPIKFNHTAPTEKGFEGVYGITQIDLTAVVNKLMENLTEGKLLEDFTQDEQDLLVVAVCHSLDAETQLASAVILGRDQTIDIIDNKTISTLVEALLPHKERFLNMTVISIAALIANESRDHASLSV